MIQVFIVTLAAGLVLNFLFSLAATRRRFWAILIADRQKGVSKLGAAGLALPFFFGVWWGLGSGAAPDPRIVTILCSFGLAFFLGVWDDVRPLSASRKLMGQLLIAGGLVAGGLRTEIIFLPSFLNYGLSIIWFVAVMNAFNFLDIADGLAAGIAVICAAAFWVVSLWTGDVWPALLSCALAAANLSFLRFNVAPARLYMGDAGSLFNGCALGAIAIMISYATPGREVALVSPLLILTLPLYDLVFVMAVRFRSRRPVTQKSPDHFILRLMAGGRSLNASVFWMYLLNFLFCVSAVVLMRSSRALGVVFLVFACCLWLVLAFRLSRIKMQGAGA